MAFYPSPHQGDAWNDASHEVGKSCCCHHARIGMKRGVRLGRNQNALKHNGVDQEDKQLAGCCLAVIIETAVDGVKNEYRLNCSNGSITWAR